MKIIGIILGIILVVVVFFVSKGKKEPVIPTKDVDVLGLEELLQFFKRPEIISLLKQDSNTIPVATKKLKKDGKIYVVACVFDKKANSILAFEKATAWNAKKLDDRLAQTFDDKEMIVLR